MNNRLLRTVEKTITVHGMLKAKDSVLIGVSGGPDSVALLHILLKIAPRFSLRLGVAHLNHCLRRNDSDQDAKFVESLAETLDLPCYMQKTDIRRYGVENRLSLEEAARSVRYKFLEDIAKTDQYNKIALGHHADDNAELVLMNLFRGTGTLGLSGIPPVRDGRIIRPLIKLSRADIMDFLKQNRLKSVFDISNADTRYVRNRVRNDLIPLLRAEYNPNISKTLNRLSSIVRSEEEWIEDMVYPYFKKAALGVQKNHVILFIPALNRYHRALQRRVIRMALAKVKGNLRRIGFANIDSIIDLLAKKSFCGNLDLPDGLRIRKDPDSVHIYRRLRYGNSPDQDDERDTFSFEYQIEKLEPVFIREIKAHVRFTEMDIENMPDYRCTGQHTNFFDKDALNLPMVLRNFRPGDAFRPLGAGGTQKLKKFFIDKKVPRRDRLKCPILLSGGKIIWVVGYRIDESVKLTPATKNVLKVELLLA
ncbi:MAG: tRNA lysidine(34) synthetase TilS [Desulfobacterales bacterium]